MENEVIANEHSIIRLGEDGILRNILRSADTESRANTVKETKEVFSAIAWVSKGKKHPFLSDIRKVKSTDRESRVFFAGEEVAKSISAMGLLVGSAVTKIIGNIFLGFNKPKYPVRVFTSESEAIEWLKGFRDDSRIIQDQTSTIREETSIGE